MADKSASADDRSPPLMVPNLRTSSKSSNSIELKLAHAARIPSVSELDLPNAGVQSARVILKLCLYRTELGLTAPTTLADEHENLLNSEIHYVQKYAQQDWLVRRWVGGSYDVWQDYQRCIDEALVSIIPRMFIAPPAPNEELPYQSATEHMCNHSGYLIRDLERINDLLLVARTLLVLNQTAQGYVVQSGTDLRILRLFEICLRVCARSNDNNPTENSEQICSAIVAICKSLLGTMMTLLNSMTASNPARMLCLWVDLFMRDTTEHLGLEAELESEIFGEQSRLRMTSFANQKSKGQTSTLTLYELDRAMVALGICQRADIHGMEDIEQRKQAIREVHCELHNSIQDGKPRDKSKSRQRTGLEKSAETETHWPPFARGFTRPICELLKWIRSSYRTAPEPSLRGQREQAHEDAKRVVVEDLQMAVPKAGEQGELDSQLRGHDAGEDINDHVPNQFESGAEGAEGQTPKQSEYSLEAVRSSVAAMHSQDGVEDSDDYSDDDGLDDDERDPYGEAFRRRGIISELPLVLSPNDIMPLCVILQNAVWLEGPLEQHDTLTRLFKAIQCHILVTQETGKNLLREVLIFVAAWDLAEGDVAFTLIAEVMESVLYHGLMPIAWHNYRESKDIVSPAQSIIVKVLGLIFRQRRKGDSVQRSPSDSLDLDNLPDEFAFDRGIIETLLEDFRSVVVPQTVALIWLQGQIRKNICLAEDFPLNVWDMERVYEGVYQFLELFAVLTETPAWKELFVRQELSFELVAILRELENSISKLTLKIPGHDTALPYSTLPQEATRDPANQPPTQRQDSIVSAGTPGSVPVAVERPYETSPSPPVGELPSELSPNARLSPGQDTIEEAEEPVDFPWRNLKKLVVLVLGSLAYKNPTVKTQVRELGGVELIMKCFEHDDHNPYIREHAVLCLNFLLERSPENQAVAIDAGVSGVLPLS